MWATRCGYVAKFARADALLGSWFVKVIIAKNIELAKSALRLAKWADGGISAEMRDGGDD